MPCLPVTLKALKPQQSDFEPQTLGEHIRKRRLQLGLTQKAAGELLGINSWTVLNWEKGKTEPPVESIAVIIGFLEYDPFPEPKSLSDRLLAARRVKGWTIKEAAQRLGVDEATWGQWEKTGIPWKRHQARVAAFLRKLGN